MNLKISSIGVVSHPEVDRRIVEKIVEILKSTNKKLFFDPVTAEKVRKKSTEVRNMNVGLIIVLGGDGTLLWTANEIRKDQLLLGINTGRVGYMTEIRADELSKRLNSLLNGKFFIDSRIKLRVNKKHEALNEVHIMAKRPSHLLEFSINLNNIEIACFRADGVMVSTPTGSTAHSLSLGGPIVHSDTEAFAIVPMNPFMLEQAPIVVPNSSKISIKPLRKNSDAHLILDGKVVDEIKPNEEALIEKAKRTVNFVRFSENFKNEYINIRKKRT
ncbi:MAG TPA: NAD(+)/NADH kinase [Candidatus Altiarchaeales archaeon]|nr:NAD(+)/NADH kinase [Candidatus Altiarchaeales archaeon]